MTTPGTSIWQPFDPSGGSLPESLSTPWDQNGVVAIVATGRTARTDWGPRVALEIARHWAREGARVMLADMGLERPSLHRVAGIENGEGMSDVFNFGASIQRIARPLDEGAFFLAPAGTITADPAGIMEHSRWEALEEGFGSASALLVLYAPEGEASLPGVLERSARVVLLGDGTSDPGELLGAAGERVAGALTPEGGLEGEEVPEAPVAAESAPEASEEGEEEARVLSSGPEEDVDVSPPPAEGWEEIPDRRNTTLWIFIVMLLVVAGAAAAVWFGWVQVPGLELPGSGGP